jgi:hypothetical protein
MTIATLLDAAGVVVLLLLAACVLALALSAFVDLDAA